MKLYCLESPCTHVPKGVGIVAASRSRRDAREPESASVLRFDSLVARDLRVEGLRGFLMLAGLCVHKE